MSQRIIGDKNIEADKGGLCISILPEAQEPVGAYLVGRRQIRFNPAQTKSLLPDVVSAVIQSNPRKAILYGGPRHGETLDISGDPYAIEMRVPKTLSSKAYVSGTGVSPITVEHIRDDRYLRTFDHHVDDRGNVLAVYEHEDLKKANVAKRAKELDEKIDHHLKELLKIEERAAVQHEQAANYRKSFIEPLVDERDQIAYDHGV